MKIEEEIARINGVLQHVNKVLQERDAIKQLVSEMESKTDPIEFFYKSTSGPDMRLIEHREIKLLLIDHYRTVCDRLEREASNILSQVVNPENHL